jgi:hypothetical protein
MVAEVAEINARKLLLFVLEQVVRCLRDEHLPAVSRGRDARRAMHREAVVALLGRRRLAGVDSHPHADVGSLRPVVIGERALRLDGREHRLARAHEGDEERVALRVNHTTAVPGEDVAQEASMFREHLPVTIT